MSSFTARPRASIRIGLAVLLPCVGGCPEKEPESPPPGVVPIRVWVVLSDEDSGIGAVGNVGCRLSEEEITQYIDALKQNTPALFGTAKNPYEWSGSCVPIWVPSSLLPGQPGGPRDPVDWETVFYEILFVQGKWTPNNLNLYFAGYLTTAGEPATMGLALDPAYPGYSEYFIVLNDGGYHVPNYKQVLTHQFPLEHEMGHFLLRREGTPGYDEYEHVAPDSEHLMKPSLPAVKRLPTSEQGEAKNRLEGDGWRQP